MAEPTTAPTLSETWVEMTTVGLGWLRGTLRTDPESVMALLRPHLGESSARSGGTRWFRQSAYLADRRVVVAWDGIGQAAGRVMVDVTQTALDGLGWEGSRALLSDLLGAGFRASRVDLYVDDRRERRASARVVRGAVVDRQYVSHADPGGYREDDHTGAATAYLGSRESERFLRVYDKDPNGFDPRTRYELETKGEVARLVASAVAAAPAVDAAAVVCAHLLAFVDFRHRSDGDRGDRGARLAWWSALVDGFTKARGVVAVKVDSLARRAGWLRRQVAPTLAAIWARPDYGNGWLNELLGDGLDRAGGLTWARN